MNIFTKRPGPAKMMLDKPFHHYAYQWLDNIKINKACKIWSKYPIKFKSYELFINWPQQGWLMLSQASSNKKGDFACQCLRNVDMNYKCKMWLKYTMWFKIYEHFHWFTMDRWTHIVIIVQTQVSCNNGRMYGSMFVFRDLFSLKRQSS